MSVNTFDCKNSKTAGASKKSEALLDERNRGWPHCKVEKKNEIKNQTAARRFTSQNRVTQRLLFYGRTLAVLVRKSTKKKVP